MNNKELLDHASIIKEEAIKLEELQSLIQVFMDDIEDCSSLHYLFEHEYTHFIAPLYNILMRLLPDIVEKLNQESELIYKLARME